MTKRTEIDQAMCDHVRILLAGGAGAEQAAAIIGVSEATISRIRRAEVSAEVYRKNKEARRKPAEEPVKQPEEQQVQGQICMDLVQAAEQKQEMSDQVKLMRFQAAQMDKLILEIDKLNDTLGMILRAIKKE